MGIAIKVKLNVDRWYGGGQLEHGATITGNGMYFIWLSEGMIEKYLRRASETEHNY